MLRYSLIQHQSTLDIWEEPGLKTRPSEDSWLVATRPDTLRLAVIDGSTAPPDALGRAGVDPAAWAAGILRTTLINGQDVTEAIKDANSYLYQPELRSQAQSMATVLVAELDRRGLLTLVRGGNCEAWLRSHGNWRSLFGPQWPEEVLSRHLDWLSDNRDATPELVSAQEETHFGHPDAWVSVPPGRFAEVKLETLTLNEEWDELVIATDGARLTKERIEDLDSWLSHIREWEALARKSYAVEKRHDDISVIRLMRK
jgi:hypothetical protein